MPSALRFFLWEKSHKTWYAARRWRGGERAFPDFIVIGAQKSGTSSMFAYLKQHGQVLQPIFKEPFFFDRNYHRGLDWYGANFPRRSSVARLNDRHGRRHLTFEATATYIFDEKVPRRIASDIDARKFIALLRNPVDRAVSNYWHACRQGLENRAIETAFKADLDWIEAERAHAAGHGPKPAEPKPRTYLKRGLYDEAVARWHGTFGRENVLVIQSETMFRDPASVMRRVFDFLDLPQLDHIDYRPQNVGGYDSADQAVRPLLTDFYAPYNARLSAICGQEFQW